MPPPTPPPPPAKAAEPERAWWRNVHYCDVEGQRGLSVYADHERQAEVRGSLPFGERFSTERVYSGGDDRWLQLAEGRWAGCWVLASSNEALHCVDMSSYKQRDGRIPLSQLRGQDFPSDLRTEGYAGAAEFSVVSASGDSLWRELNVEMLCRDVATATLFENAWEGDAVFQDWVAYYATNITKFSQGKHFVVVVKPTERWASFKGGKQGVSLAEVEQHVGRVQWKELGWIHRSQRRLDCRWDDIEFLTAFSFLQKYCRWSDGDCRCAANEKLAAFCAEFHTKDSVACEHELRCALWTWAEAFETDFTAVGKDVAICYGVLEKLARREGRPPLNFAPTGQDVDAWQQLLIAAMTVAPDLQAALLREPLLYCLLGVVDGQARRIVEQARRIAELEAERKEPDDEPEIVVAAPEAAIMPSEPPIPVGLLFPGQGSQYVKMMTSVQDIPKVKEYLAKAKDILGWDVLELCLQGPESKLEETKYCQPCMFIAGMAGIEKLRGEKKDAAERFMVTAGLSPGEYTALCAAGVFSFEDGLKLVDIRGKAMQEAAAVGKQAMLSVAGLDKPKMESLCAEAKKKEGGVCQIADELFPKGFTCAGSEPAIVALKHMSEKAGALQAKLLNTSGAFQTSLMAPAKDKLGKALDEMLPKMSPPRHIVYMNATASAVKPGTDPKEIVELLKRQLTSPVLWEPSVRAMIKAGVTEFYEVGPMKFIKALMKRIDSTIFKTTTNVEI